MSLQPVAQVTMVYWMPAQLISAAACSACLCPGGSSSAMMMTFAAPTSCCACSGLNFPAPPALVVAVWPSSSSVCTSRSPSTR